MAGTYNDVTPRAKKLAAPQSSDVVEFCRKRLQFEPDEKQQEVLRWDGKRGILNCTRQWGKSTIAAAKAVHRAYTRPNSLVLMASPSDRQSAEFLRKAAGMVRRLGITPRGDGDNATSLLFPNGSRIVGLPGREATVRGFSAVSLLLIDEAARVDDAMYKALRPMLAVGAGDLWLMSTPCGRRGFFFQEWEFGGEKWKRVSVKALDCPRIDRDFLEDERERLGSAWFDQEYSCEFVESEGQLFDWKLIEDALDSSFEPLKL